MKTNKSYAKRIRLTKHGKLLSRKSGQNHFNAKARRVSQLGKKGMKNFVLNAKDKSRFMAN